LVWTAATVAASTALQSVTAVSSLPPLADHSFGMRSVRAAHEVGVGEVDAEAGEVHVGLFSLDHAVGDDASVGVHQPRGNRCRKSGAHRRQRVVQQQDVGPLTAAVTRKYRKFERSGQASF